MARRPVRTTYPDIPPYPGAILISVENPDGAPTDYKNRVFSYRASASSAEILAYYRHYLEQIEFTVTAQSGKAVHSYDSGQCPIIGIDVDILSEDMEVTYRVALIPTQCERR